MRILIADDDQHICEKLGEMVRRLSGVRDSDLDVALARTGLQALQIARQQPIDIGFIDYNLGGMNGIQTIERIHDPFGTVSFILISGEPQETLIQPINQAFTVAPSRVTYLAKPVTDASFLGAWRTALDRVRERPRPDIVGCVYQSINSLDTFEGKSRALVAAAQSMTQLWVAIISAQIGGARLSGLGSGHRISFGRWIATLRRRLDQAVTLHESLLARQLSDAASRIRLRVGSKKLTIPAFLNALRADRNEQLGHGIPQADAYYRPLYEKYVHGIRHLYESMAFLGRHPVFVALNSRRVRGDPASICTTVRSMSANGRSNSDVVLSGPEALVDGSLYLWVPDREPVALDPVLAAAQCPSCNHSWRMGGPDVIRADDIEYLGTCNHRFTVPRPRGASLEHP